MRVFSEQSSEKMPGGGIRHCELIRTYTDDMQLVKTEVTNEGIELDRPQPDKAKL